MVARLFTTLALVLAVVFTTFHTASAQNRVHGYAVDTNAAAGTSWMATQFTPLWPYPQDSGFPQKLTIPQGASFTSTSGFTNSATGIYIQVNYNGVVGWVDQRDIRIATAARPAPTTNVASGVSYFVTNVNNWASLRRSTSTQSYRLAKVPFGAAVVSTGQQISAGGYQWLGVTYNGVQGWMPTRYLTSNGGFAGNNNAGTGQANPNGAYPVGEYRIINVNNWASLRSWASRSAGRLTTVPRGNIVYHGGERQHAGGELWLRVQFNGFAGWMPVQYLGLN